MRPKFTLQEKLYDALSVAERAYIQDCVTEINQDYKRNFNKIFSTLSRKLMSSKDQLISIEDDLSTNKLIVQHWTVLRLARVFLISLIQDERDTYCQFIEGLFKYGDLYELEALYSALNILDYPEEWINRCQEGIRSNMGFVQEAVIENNKYPYLYLDEQAWNQLVLKSFFTSKNVLKIFGLFERNNPALADAIVDYIYERHSAKRNIHPILWLLAMEYLPERAILILQETLPQTEEILARSILYHVLQHNTVKYPHIIDLNQLSNYDILPFSEDILQSYKNGELCVQN